MQKTNITRKHQRSHTVRVGAVAIAIATIFHVSGLSHLYTTPGHYGMAEDISRVFADHMERENETARHAVRFDEGLRLPATTGQ